VGPMPPVEASSIPLRGIGGVAKESANIIPGELGGPT
jgi:hypothetical protein